MLALSQPNATKFGKMMVNHRLLVLWFSLFLYLVRLLCCLIVFFAFGTFTDFSSLVILFTDVKSSGSLSYLYIIFLTAVSLSGGS